jgi:prepilin signal peptidase PulO-like enzyme (type II secretory pathway)
VPSLPAGWDLFVPLLGATGLAWGILADRIGARWPAHEDGSVRGVDWRTVVVALFGAVALAAIPVRFGGPAERVLFGVMVGAWVLLLATDLDQRLMPDLITLPLIALGALALVWGGDSLVSRSPAWTAVMGAILVPGGMFLLSLPFGEGAFGGGDVKFLVGLGLSAGLIRVVIAAFAGSLLGGVVIMALLISRRITLKSYVPFGPFLIVAAVWAILIPASS